MGFSEKFNTISSILLDNYKIKIKENDYDGYIVKQMSESNCIKKDITSKQSHIAITGSQMELFPYIYSKQFIEDNDSSMKNYFVLKAPVNIHKTNCDAILDMYIDFGNKQTLKEEMCVYPRSGGEQIQLSMKQNGDSKNFLKFRELIKPNDYFVVLKKDGLLEYDAFIIEGKYIEDKSFKSLFEQSRNSIKDITFVGAKSIESNASNLDKRINQPHQRIFFGAPGTGKSYELNKEAKEYFGNNYERVTFHPNYMYGNFVGAFKPFPKVLKNNDGTIKKDEDGNIQESITYEYIPGVFMRQLVRALKCPTQDYLLLIEEINRANVAAVFGDIFQLLDRDSFGESEYFIATSKELQEFLKKEFDDCDLEKNIKEKLGEDFGKLYLPNNLYIWATMNSADQGVMPMDTAFRRRWEFRYLGINDAAESNKEDFEKYKFKINSSEVVNWDVFRRELNKKLSSLNIPEDKLIGPYFVSKSILEDSDLDRLTETIKNKVLMYLYEDAAKAYRPSLFAEGKYATYSSVCKYFDDNALNLFKGNIEIKTQLIETNQAYDYSETDEVSIAAEDGVEYES
ncbi:AAA family ATPase [Peptoniphilus asaccharolyticus]